MAEKSKILIIGGTGYIGKFIVEASAKAGHPTFALVRESTIGFKANLVEKFKNLGVHIINGDLNDHHEVLVKAVKQVDVVISTVGSALVGDQLKIIDAIKDAEFGNDVDHMTHAVDPAKKDWAKKAEIRRAVEAKGIPYTYVATNFSAGYFLHSLSQLDVTSPPRDKIVILGDGTPKAIFTEEGDIGTYTIRSINDPRTLYKTLHIRPAANTISFNELVSLWEKKIGKTLEKVYVPEQQVLKNIQETEFPRNVLLALMHAVYVKGDHTNFGIDPSVGVEATELYPDVKYTTVDKFLDQFV
ncbi:hypothetical protein KSS87_014042 [Heliosperma pusillum]|nr:hypothetical protein KSS87_014042 [Heliosperma pusillum]